MTRRRRVILAGLASSLVLAGVALCIHQFLRWADLSDNKYQIGSDGVVDTRYTTYTTRPLRIDQMRAQVFPVKLPAEAKDIQFAEYGEWVAYQFYGSFSAPPDVCLAYAQAVLDDHNKSNPDRQMPGLSQKLTTKSYPFGPSRTTRALGRLETPLPWFNPEAIKDGVEGGGGVSTPTVWVDTERGIFYYEETR